MADTLTLVGTADLVEEPGLTLRPAKGLATPLPLVPCKGLMALHQTGRPTALEEVAEEQVALAKLRQRRQVLSVKGATADSLRPRPSPAQPSITLAVVVVGVTQIPRQQVVAAWAVEPP